MMAQITHVEVTGPHRVALTFSDGTHGVVDLGPKILSWGGVFIPLHDPSFFAKVFVDHVGGTIAWPNNVDLDPDVLYEAAHAASVARDK